MSLWGTAEWDRSVGAKRNDCEGACFYMDFFRCTPIRWSRFAFFIHLWPSPLLTVEFLRTLLFGELQIQIKGSFFYDNTVVSPQILWPSPSLFWELFHNTTPIRFSRFASPLSLQSSYFITSGRLKTNQWTRRKEFASPYPENEKECNERNPY